MMHELPNQSQLSTTLVNGGRVKRKSQSRDVAGGVFLAVSAVIYIPTYLDIVAGRSRYSRRHEDLQIW